MNTEASGPQSQLAEMADLSGRTALITGGLGHLGLTMAKVLVSFGANIVLVDRPGTTMSGEWRDTLAAAGSGKVDILLADLADPVQIERLIADILATYPVIDMLINNAAFVGTSASEGWATTFEKQSAELWRQAVEINLTAPFRLVQGLLPALRASNAASILNIASIYGLVGPDLKLYEGTTMGNPAAYAASKGGIIQFTRYLATSLAPQIRVNCVAPGGIERNQNKNFQDQYIARTPMNRMATLKDFEGVVIFLTSSMSSYVTGQIIAVDGGWTAW